MESSQVQDPEYIEKKRAELQYFFKDANFPKETIDKITENELKPLIEGTNHNTCYITASASGPVKSEYDVMSGQPFTNIEVYNRPLTKDEIREKLKDNPIIEEKAKQIQISINSQNKNIAVPLDEIQLPKYSEMKDELDSAAGDFEKTNAIKYKNSQILMNAAAEYRAKSKINKASTLYMEEIISDESNDDKEFEAIDKAVTECTNKSYETRFQETKEMFQQLADKYEDPNHKENNSVNSNKMKIEDHPILKESSYCLIQPNVKQSPMDMVKESYAINEALNIPIKDNKFKPQYRSEDEVQMKKNKQSNVAEPLISNFETKLKSTEKCLKDISSILNPNSSTKDCESVCNSRPNDLDSTNTNEVEPSHVEDINDRENYGMRIEETLQNALQDIFKIGRTENAENNDLEYSEMRSLARNIVEGAENLSTLIREDITNKLNSMNELLNDVNETLENSRKSNLAYQKLKEEGEARKQCKKIQQNITKEIDDSQVNEITADRVNKSNTVTQLEIDDINNAIHKLNNEIQNHETRVNTCKSNYEIRNKECQDFMKEVDGVLQKSHDILHPQLKDNKFELAEVSQEIKTTNDKSNMIKKEEVERNKKIDGLLIDIKDKMKDNKEVLRLANNLLRREEKKKLRATSNIQELPEIDEKAKGDFIRDDELKENAALKVSEMSSLEKVRGKYLVGKF